MMKRIMILGLSFIAGGVSAQEADVVKPDLPRVINELDLNRDGKFDANEIVDDALFKKYDADKDGFITRKEMQGDAKGVTKACDRYVADVKTEEFSIVDHDDSGDLSKQKLRQRWGALLESGDSDDDGKISKEEARAPQRTV